LVTRLAHRLRPPPRPPPLHPPLPPPDQRQSRSADQDTPPRVGLSLRLPEQPPPHESPARLHPLVQPTPTPLSPRRQAAPQPCRGPVWSVHLEQGARLLRVPSHAERLES